VQRDHQFRVSQVRLPLLPAGTGSVSALLTCLAGLGEDGDKAAGLAVAGRAEPNVGTPA